MVDQLLFPIEELILVSAVSAQKYKDDYREQGGLFFVLSLGGKIK